MIIATKKQTVYKPVAKPVSIACTSRCSVKVRDNYYTIEYKEERVIPQELGVDLAKEREALWDTVNKECDAQIADILKSFKK